MGGYVPPGGTYPDGHVNDGSHGGGGMNGPAPTTSTSGYPNYDVNMYLADGGGGYKPATNTNPNALIDQQSAEQLPSSVQQALSPWLPSNGATLNNPGGGSPSLESLFADLGLTTGGGSSAAGVPSTGASPSPVQYSTGIDVGTMGPLSRWAGGAQDAANLGVAQTMAGLPGGIPADMMGSIGAGLQGSASDIATSSALGFAQPMGDMYNQQQFARAGAGVDMARTISQRQIDDLLNRSRHNTLATMLFGQTIGGLN